jgi:murein DD-endopeptidase MepM/ murein hydrolase activator NlpD
MLKFITLISLVAIVAGLIVFTYIGCKSKSSKVAAQSEVTPTAKRISPVPAIENLIKSREPDTQWKGLSLLIAIYRSEGKYDELTKRFEAFISSNQGSTHAAWVRHVIAENYLLAGASEKALTAFEELARLYGNQKQGERTWESVACGGMANAHVKAGSATKAIQVLEAFNKDHPGQINLTYLQAQLLAKEGNHEAAIRLLKAITQLPHDKAVNDGGEGLVQLARQLLEMEQSERAWIVVDPMTLVDRLDGALAKRDIGELSALASPIEFSMGSLGTESSPQYFKELRPIFESALRAGSMPQLAKPLALIEREEKMYVLTKGWRSAELSDEVWLVLTKTLYGWEWSGAAMSGPFFMRARDNSPDPDFEEEPTIDSPPPTEQEGEQEGLRFTLLAPWEEGVHMLSGDCDIFGPEYGGSCTSTMGWPGYYYGQKYHTGAEHFAIDFNAWTTSWGVPVTKGGQTVCSVAAGKVIKVDASEGKVVVDHLNAQGFEDGYSSRYLHMAHISVVEGQYVARGTPLGKVDDKGKHSKGDHLHFALYDSKTTNESVMPSPLEGTPRGLLGHIKCIKSTNSDLFVDSDGDGVTDAIDICPEVYNPDQGDSDNNGVGDACDDWDNDGVLDANDNCRSTPNPGQADIDHDGVGDVCDADKDGDRVECITRMGSLYCGVGPLFPVDNCLNVANPDQGDLDRDGTGDACDSDKDGDGILNAIDLCPDVYDPSNTDSDHDRVGDPCDNCADIWNPDQGDADRDGIGNKCDLGDTDGDGILDKDDPCPGNPSNPCGPPMPPPDLQYLDDIVRADFVFHTLQERFGVPIGPGPECRFCPPRESAIVELAFEEVPREFEIGVIDNDGRKAEVQQVSSPGKILYSFRLPHRKTYYLVMQPTTRTRQGRQYEVRYIMRFYMPPVR